MALVAEQELQRVYSQWQRHSCFRLPGAEVQMIEVIRDRLVERGQLGIDQEMVMAGIGLFDACWRYAHIDQTKAKGRFLRKHGPVLQADEIHARVGRRRFAKRGIDHADLDALRHDRRGMGNMILVSHEQLKSVLTVLERNLGLGLAATEVKVIEVIRDRLIERR